MLIDIDIEQCLELQREINLIDVRSPGEFEKGHIPGAYNIPLFTNAERAHVGTVYKQESPQKAYETGYVYVEPKLDHFISESLSLAPGKKIMVHCWRGGMRSRSFAQHLSDNGFETVYVLKGGYKAYRRYLHRNFTEEKSIVLIGGYTGTGKTRMLYELKKMGEQVIDLEGLAHHKGSAFGGIGQQPQPTTEQFENNLFDVWKNMNKEKTLWIEDESMRIGDVNLPEKFFQNIRKHPLLFIDMPRALRVKHLVEEYAVFPKDRLETSIKRIGKRLGFDRVKTALQYLEVGAFDKVAELALIYYDKYYNRGLVKRRGLAPVYTLRLNTLDFKKNALKLKQFYESIEKRTGTANSVL